MRHWLLTTSFLTCAMLGLFGMAGCTPKNAQQNSMAVPYSLNPDFATNPFALGDGGQWGTGLALADIDRNGYPDLVVSAGNDKDNQNVVVYFNSGGNNISATPGWSSADKDHHGTLAVGDIDGNGWPDVAVSVFLGKDLSYEGGGVKVYYNYGPPNYLTAAPTIIDTGYPSYGCALGDMDGDGDLDLAVAGGEPIPEVESFATQTCGDAKAPKRHEGTFAARAKATELAGAGGTQEPPFVTQGRIYINNGGTFSKDAVWTTSDSFVAMAVEFADANYDGLMDVIFQSAPVRIYLGMQVNGKGGIQTTPGWMSTDANYYGNGFDYASSMTLPGSLEKPVFSIAASSNSYMGQGRGGFSLYRFLSPFVIQYTPHNSTPNWQSRYGDWGSGVRLSDVDSDGDLDMLTHRWNTPGFNDLNGRLLIYQGNGGLFTETPVWESAATSIIEVIQVADLDRKDEQSATVDITISDENWSPAQVGQSVVYLPQQVIASVNTVSVNGILLNAGKDYVFVTGRNWLSFTKPIPAQSVVTVNYSWSEKLDVVYTNWNCDLGNYIYFHQ
ncbi:VCBS repeat-containing protein [Desulfovibrio mangrovi]|uniref:FG-GAP repeat domain-containing protein n=1 Tax=Desulfovibrio mangrovi TaxID=2976983 RepID=UPI0022486CB6|nr:VCBS repeat-containing protein [Desulfovibrio mangrovi]UZP66313.1 VCBS repeat-containing protein [Desulfovibrio mangrovi]